MRGQHQWVAHLESNLFPGFIASKVPFLENFICKILNKTSSRIFKSNENSKSFLSIEHPNVGSIPKVFLYFKYKKSKEIQELPSFELLSILGCLVASFKAVANKDDFIRFEVRQTTEQGIHSEFSGTVRHTGRWIESALSVYDAQFSVILISSLGYTPQVNKLDVPHADIRRTKPYLPYFLNNRLQSKIFSFRRKMSRSNGSDWNFGVTSSDNRCSSSRSITYAEKQNYQLLADPFAFAINGRKFIFCEALKKGKGIIVLYELTDHGLSFKSEVLEELTHLSFPQIFEVNSKIYMLPETSESCRIDVYTTESFPLNWRHFATLVENVDAVDSLAIEHEGKFWILTCLNLGIIRNNHTMQWLFEISPSENFKTKSMAVNPTQLDGAKVRNGGLLKMGGKKIRISQAPAFGTYGKSISFHEVRAINDSGYFESSIEDLNLFDTSEFSQVHHLSGSDEFFAFDFILQSEKNLNL